MTILGTTHGTETSRQQVKQMIASIKPSELALPEAVNIIEDPCSEFNVAVEEATKCGAKIIYGDINDKSLTKLLSEGMPLEEIQKLVELSGEQKVSTPEEKAKLIFHNLGLLLNNSHLFPVSTTEVIIRERDKLMFHNLLKAAAQHTSILAVVGAAHIPGLSRHLIMEDRHRA